MMKLLRSQKFWIAASATVFVGSLVACAVILSRPHSSRVNIKQNGTVVMTLDLDRESDRTIEFVYEGRKNVVEIKDGRVHMLSADCPDHVCVHTGWLRSGIPIVCLPNKLSVEFSDSDSDTDAVTR